MMKSTTLLTVVCKLGVSKDLTIPIRWTRRMASVRISTVGWISKYDIDSSTKWITAPNLYTTDIFHLSQRVKNHLINLFPKSLVSDLQQFKNMSDPQMLLIKNLPFIGSEAFPMAECFLLGVSALMSMKPFTYKNEHQGRLFHHIAPNPKYEYSQTALSSRAELELHTENAFDPNRPVNMGLYCLIGDPGAKTTFYSVSKLQSKMNLDLKERLIFIGKKHEFIFEHPESHSSGRSDYGALFFDMTNGQLGTRFCAAFAKGQTERAQKLKLEIRNFLLSENNHPNGYYLEAGDLILWSNYTVLHGRSTYAPNYRPNMQRFLIRMYLTNDQSLPYLRN
ncbi:unnamed protein product [Rotaria magnacalcarata]|uniref:TauD/TfdA-like domain-containing protein n=1 Tax=Rotaria magnacalcarata TaxID=392030 RepID=A0A816MWN3_9BILA|nr:unnamed protein product [Rotaria magnacalcarata]